MAAHPRSTARRSRQVAADVLQDHRMAPRGNRQVRVGVQPGATRATSQVPASSMPSVVEVESKERPHLEVAVVVRTGRVATIRMERASLAGVVLSSCATRSHHDFRASRTRSRRGSPQRDARRPRSASTPTRGPHGPRPPSAARHGQSSPSTPDAHGSMISSTSIASSMSASRPGSGVVMQGAPIRQSRAFPWPP